MGIKRGVSLYSYQQEEWFGRMTWRDELREVATNLGGATGIEIISEATIPQFPFASEAFFQEWNFEMARWGLEAVTMDVFPDPLMFRRDHVMNAAEQAERLRMELRVAKKMGFKNLRVLGSEIETIALALPLAEELDISLNQEIHFPSGIRRGAGRFGGKTMDILEFIEKTGTKHYGFHPDFGIFKKGPTRIYIGYYFRSAGYEEWEKHTQNFIDHFNAAANEEEIAKWCRDTYPDVFSDPVVLNMELRRASALPEDLKLIAPYIKCCHGKFYEMTEVPGEPGHYEEVSLDYENPIRVLKEIGYEGYINSEYEGQRSQQDRGEAYMANEIEEVRRHHEMMKRLIEA